MSEDYAAVRSILASLPLWASLGASVVGAQDISYQRIPIGNRAVGMGGAYTGVAEDLSAVWYNPGGLAFPEGVSISGGLSINVLNEFVVDRAFGYGSDRVALSDEGSLSVPFFVGGVAKLGRADDHDYRRHAIAVAAVNPSAPSRRFDVASAAPGGGAAAALRVQSENRIQQYGPSYAHRLDDDLGIGISAFLSIHDFSHDESEIVNVVGERQPDGSFADSSVRARISSGQASVVSLLLRVGALWRPTDRLSVGLMLQLPNLPLHRSGHVEELIDAVDETGSGVFRGGRQETVPELRQPFEARLGIGYQPLENWRLAFDVSVYGPLGSEGDPLLVFGETVPDEHTGFEPRAGRLVANEVWAQPSFNLATGMETVIADVVPLSLGVYTDLSPTRSIEASSTTYRQPHLDNVGLTALIGYRSGGYNVAVGGALVLGWGNAFTINPDPDAADVYVPRDARQTSLYFFLTGYADAAKQLVREVESLTRSDDGPREEEEGQSSD